MRRTAVRRMFTTFLVSVGCCALGAGGVVAESSAAGRHGATRGWSTGAHNAWANGTCWVGVITRSTADSLTLRSGSRAAGYTYRTFTPRGTLKVRLDSGVSDLAKLAEGERAAVIQTTGGTTWVYATTSTSGTWFPRTNHGEASGWGNGGDWGNAGDWAPAGGSGHGPGPGGW